MLEYLPEFNKQAEEYLSKAHKLMSTNVEPLNALGSVFWKKGDIKQSINCFEKSLEIDSKNKDILKKLSMVIRLVSEGDLEKRRDNYARSIKLATNAIAMDMKDSHSWYVLGNAHLTNFFTNNTDTEQLNLALKAYAQSEKWM